ncbi:hypothetical protein CEE37_09905 [candidate division LCP-89 bacterium B3_LCP]|uniref:Uncharacterized protein n=1 Tax=candidate division LCP-89 bacterium B3_LCP TaxID=2012998 RepID=A0A532UYK7_UNCL8|nr:MAG: hypothetical protein CEE37_09905 [candidate division LCP-89 bacterium B3_LCP]
MTWQQRNTVGKDRVEELTELYESLGYAVKVDRFTGPETSDETCDSCYGDPSGEYFIIYTKKRSELP